MSDNSPNNKPAPIKLFFKTFEAECGSRSDLSPIIFLHGIFGTHATWNHVAEVIANKTGRKVYSYDARNHGDSLFSEEYSYVINIDDLFNFMDAQDISKAILVGHSMGGLTVNRAALRMPERIEMVFVEDMYVKFLSQNIIDVLKEVCVATTEVAQSIPKECTEIEAMQSASKLMREKVPGLSHGFFRKENTCSNLFKRMLDGTYCSRFNAQSILKALNEVENFPKDPLNQYEGPSYFIYDGKSPMDVGSHQEHIKRHFPNAEFIVFEGCSHDIHGALPEKFVQILSNRIPL